MNNSITRLTYLIKLFIIIYIIGFSHSALLPFIMEMTAITLLARYRSHLLKIILMIFVVIEGAQLSSIFNTGFYIQTLTLTNLSEVNSVGNSVISSTIIITLFYLALFLKPSKKPINGFSLACLLFSLVISLFLFRNTPIYNFSNSIYEACNQYINSLSAKNPDNAKYFKRTYISSEKDNIPSSLNSKNHNVIVIFTEGFSSVVMSDEITPNLIKLSRQSVNFLNYYNHTAATFRGIRGQLTSGYQFMGGFNSENAGVGQISVDAVKERFNGKLISIPNILSAHNYESYFLASNSRHANLSQMISTLGFDDVYGREDVNGAIDGELTDKQSYELLWKKINEPHDKPFFMGVYTVGTHLGMDSPDEKFGDGKNEYNNKFYNLDYQFGAFFKKFKNSNISDNTILIFTADHAAFPTPKFKETFNSKSNEFVDKIPFIIYNKNAKAIDFDADGKNSLDMAPTLLDILEIKNGDNYFLGCSLFDSKCTSNFDNTTAIGDFIVNTQHAKIRAFDNPEIKKKINLFYTISG